MSSIAKDEIDFGASGEEEFRALYEHAPVALLHCDAAARIRRVNLCVREQVGEGTAEDLLGAAAESLAGDAFSALAIRDAFAQARELGSSNDRVFLVAAGKDRRWVRGSMRALRDGLGTLTGYAVVAVDAGALLRAEAELRASDATCRVLYEDSPVCVLHLAADGRVERVNRAVLEVTGCRQEELTGKPVQMLVVAADRREVDDAVRDAVAGRRIQRELRSLRRDGTPIRVRSCIRPIRDSAGRLQGFVGIAVDISDPGGAR